jgi:hypothetical protein
MHITCALLKQSRKRIHTAKDSVAAAHGRVHDARNVIQRAMIARYRRRTLDHADAER